VLRGGKFVRSARGERKVVFCIALKRFVIVYKVFFPLLGSKVMLSNAFKVC
jgi:hypothetical protein